MKVRDLLFLGLFLIIGMVFVHFNFSLANDFDLYSLFRQGDYETIVSLKPKGEEELFLYFVSLLRLDREEEVEKEIVFFF